MTELYYEGKMDLSPHKSDYVTVNGIRLHYLDWGGAGPAILFLTGMGLSAHIYDRFAPRFTDHFRVLALTRRGHGDSDCPETGYDPDTLTEDVRLFLDQMAIEKVILVGHSLANIELSHFSAKYPERVISLVYLDAAFDYSMPENEAVQKANPLSTIQNIQVDGLYSTMGEYVEAIKRTFHSLAVIWGDVMDEEITHSVAINSEGKIVDKMPEAVGAALFQSIKTYTPEHSLIKAPTLSFFALLDGADFISLGYMTNEQQDQVVEYFEAIRVPFIKLCVERFQEKVPHARIVVIPNGHHYCFIKQEEMVYEEMRKFLMENPDYGTGAGRPG